MDNSDRLKILAVRGLFTPKEPKTEPSKAPLKKPENMKDEEILPQQGSIFYRQQIPKILVWERWRAAQPPEAPHAQARAQPSTTPPPMFMLAPI